MKITPSFALLALSAALSFSGGALAQQKLIPAQSEISFVTKQMGVPLDGHFKKFDAQISFDTAKPDAAKSRLPWTAAAPPLVRQSPMPNCQRLPGSM